MSALCGSEIIRKMKGLDGESPARFPIRDGDMNVIGYLSAFGENHLDDAELIETMARFHTLYKECFMTQFDVTPDNKRNWLKNSVLGNDCKMLFLVETVDGRIIGQDGFTLDEGRKICYLDATMRWSRGGGFEIFNRSAVERMAMGFFIFGCEKCVSEIFEKNDIMTSNAFREGLILKTKFSLHVSANDGIVTYRKEDKPELINTEEILLSFGIDRAGFAELHKQIVENPCWSVENCGKELSND